MASGCATCPGSRLTFNELLRMGPDFTDADMVKVEYIGPDKGKQYFIGISSRQRYPFGYCIGCTERYVLREDLGGFLADTANFRVYSADNSTQQLAGVASSSTGEGSLGYPTDDKEQSGSN